MHTHARRRSHRVQQLRLEASWIVLPESRQRRGPDIREEPLEVLLGVHVREHVWVVHLRLTHSDTHDVFFASKLSPFKLFQAFSA